MAENREPGEETIGNATRTRITRSGSNVTEYKPKSYRHPLQSESNILKEPKEPLVKKERVNQPQGKNHRVLRTTLAFSLAAGAAAAGIEATLHPIEHIIQRVNAEYKVGERLNPDKVFEVKLVNSLDKQGQLIEPHALVTIDGQVRSISLDDPNLSDVFRQDSFRGFTVIGQGEYHLGSVTNPDFKKNLAAAFNLPKDIGEHFNRLQVGKDLPPLGVYFQPVGGFYTENGHQFQAILPLNAVQLSGSTRS